MMSAVDGHSWALCAIEEDPVPKMVTALNKDLVPLTDSPVVVQQHNIPPNKFVLLSAKVRTLFIAHVFAYDGVLSLLLNMQCYVK